MGEKITTTIMRIYEKNFHVIVSASNEEGEVNFKVVDEFPEIPTGPDLNAQFHIIVGDICIVVHLLLTDINEDPKVRTTEDLMIGRTKVRDIKFDKMLRLIEKDLP